MADQLFQHLDADGVGDVDLNDLKHIIGPYVQPGYKVPQSARSSRPVSKAGQTSEDRKKDAEFHRLVEVIRSKAHHKYRNSHEAFRCLDLDKDGLVSREECKQFITLFGFTGDVGDRIFDRLAPGGPSAECMDYKEFMATLGLTVRPGIQRGNGLNGGAPRRPQSARLSHSARPASARSVQRGGTATGLEVRGTARPASVHSASTRCSQGNSSQRTPSRDSAGSGEWGPYFVSAPPTARDGRCSGRSEVCPAPRGNYMYVPDTLPVSAASQQTWDSTAVGNRLRYNMEFDPNTTSRTFHQGAAGFQYQSEDVAAAGKPTVGFPCIEQESDDSPTSTSPVTPEPHTAAAARPCTPAPAPQPPKGPRSSRGPRPTSARDKARAIMAAQAAQVSDEFTAASAKCAKGEVRCRPPAAPSSRSSRSQGRRPHVAGGGATAAAAARRAQGQRSGCSTSADSCVRPASSLGVSLAAEWSVL